MTTGELAGPLGLLAEIALGALAPFLVLPLLTALFGAPLAPIQRTVAGLAEDLSTALAAFARVCLVVLALGMLAVVVLRYVFGESFTRLSEAVMYAHALAFLLAGPAALIGNGHVRVDVLYEGMSAKARAMVDVAGFSLFLGPLMLVLLAYSGPVVELAWRIGERSNETDGLPLVWALKTAMPVFACAMLAAGVAHAGRAALRLRGLDGGTVAPPDLAPGPADPHHTHAGAMP
ncbi:MAG: TRAP transporter small permease subunit [Hyphomonadaceae bacterium]|nr:TRAP transporter small permease subunit [Hyphomonadaceae bacterium]